MSVAMRLIAVGLCAFALHATAAPQTTLRILTWEGYADEDLVAQFEQQNNVNLDISYAYSDDELWQMFNETQNDPYDLIAVNTAELQRYIHKGLLRPVNTQSIPNIQKQTPRFQQQQNIPGIINNEKLYAVPYAYSEMGLIYNRVLVNQAPESISALWDEKYAGKVLAFNTSTHNFTLAALNLGFPHPFQMTSEELTAAARRLVALRRNVLTFYSSPQEVVKLFKTQDIAIIYANYGTQQLKALRDVGADVGYTLPPDGTLAWLDCWAIASNSKGDLAERWINFSLSEKMSLRLSNTHGLANTIQNTQQSQAIPLIWLEPIKNSEQRNNLWESILSGDVLERFK